ncbi:hypothetical protein EYF80_002225 [Liparis tanakae]|uniref:Uncharacterized protein n=1 Tax=Liparis tanakae TaxID=230148 RepID=A0A4Z2JCZ4_9TELE|nr:hypothetical protein EYF80_002225 [Liparis tanakae]
MQLPEASVQNSIIRDQKVNISECAQKIQPWRTEPLHKDLCRAKASVRDLTELMDKTTLDQTLKIEQGERVGNIGTVVTKEEMATGIQAWRTKPSRKDLCRASNSVRALTEMDNNGIKMDYTLNIEEKEKFENIRINLINTTGSVYQVDHLIGEMQLPENCMIHDQKVNISEDAQKTQAWRTELLEKYLCGAKASVRDLTELMENKKIEFDNILNLERLEVKRLTVENMKLRGTPAVKNTSDEENLKIYIQKADKLKKDLWKWKQRATSTESELQGAQVTIKDLLENASLKETVNPMPLGLEAPDNTQVVLEKNTFLTTELHTADVNIQDHLESIVSFNVAANRVPLGRRAPANTQVVLKEENTFLNLFHSTEDAGVLEALLFPLNGLLSQTTSINTGMFDIPAFNTSSSLQRK